MKRFLSSILVLMTFCSGLTVSVHAAEENEFPLTIPKVGVMTVDKYDSTVAAVRTNGTVNIQISGKKEEMLNEVADIHNAVDVAVSYASADIVAVLCDDGTVRAAKPYENLGNELFNDLSTWNNIADIDSGSSHFVGLKTDGTVVAAGYNLYGECNVFGWKNVIAIYANDYYTIGIKSDGTLYMAGKLNCANELRKEKNVKQLSVYLGNQEYIGITNDNHLFGKLSARYTIADIENTIISNNIKIEDISNISWSMGMLEFLDKHGNFYIADFAGSSNPIFEKAEENIYKVIYSSYKSYMLLDNNGQIISTDLAFTSDDWVLTTNIIYNGNKINADVPPYIKDGRTLAPMRAILEALGMTVSWDGTTQTATAVKADININISINSNIAIVNGKQETLDVPAEITNGRTFVPVRFFAEALNMNVDWDAYTKTVVINSK